ncbi:MAG: septum formation inhibitor Maf [Magnetococcales bacterium]|nr:septum formation inhibitor Maf [Magnetococcales bacterium]
MTGKKQLFWLKKGRTICLASASPRRLELLVQVGIEPFVYPTDVNETIYKKEKPKKYAKRMAIAKAQAGLKSGHDIILGADTVVVLDGKVLGKPADKRDAINMLSKLSGRQHKVITAIAIISPKTDKILAKEVETKVWFKKVSKSDIRKYVATNEPMDKAGSYGIQGVGAFLVKKIKGSYSGVVGLPLFETLHLLTNSN